MVIYLLYVLNLIGYLSPRPSCLYEQQFHSDKYDKYRPPLHTLTAFFTYKRLLSLLVIWCVWRRCWLNFRGVDVQPSSGQIRLILFGVLFFYRYENIFHCKMYFDRYTQIHIIRHVNVCVCVCVCVCLVYAYTVCVHAYICILCMCYMWAYAISYMCIYIHILLSHWSHISKDLLG